jgi:hypothetical protein
VIHRDIKPSKVLVALYDDKLVPKVIDFGVAKATGGTLTELTIDTGFGGVVGTPAYMLRGENGRGKSVREWRSGNHPEAGELSPRAAGAEPSRSQRRHRARISSLVVFITQEFLKRLIRRCHRAEAQVGNRGQTTTKNGTSRHGPMGSATTWHPRQKYHIVGMWRRKLHVQSKL